MHLHSTLDGRAGAFRLRGAAWELDSFTFRGFLYLIPVRDSGDGGRHRVVDAEGDSMWKLIDALSDQVSPITGATVERLDAHAVVARRHRPDRDRAAEAAA